MTHREGSRRHPDYRFAKAYTVDANGCWIWLRYLDASGYAMFKDGKTYLAHRWSYERHVGPIPAGLEIDHLCCVKRCVNPLHLEPVTHGENIRRRTAALTHCKRGHEFTPENTYIYNGLRTCRRCGALRAAAYKARKRASVKS